ncbi:hypothetical protein KEM55_006759 [Ascosphaera atra]|nr:hypothetical protein KEM55_006759 [Ascosphaera atra]
MPPKRSTSKKTAAEPKYAKQGHQQESEHREEQQERQQEEEEQGQGQRQGQQEGQKEKGVEDRQEDERYSEAQGVEEQDGELDNSDACSIQLVDSMDSAELLTLSKEALFKWLQKYRKTSKQTEETISLQEEEHQKELELCRQEAMKTAHTSDVTMTPLRLDSPKPFSDSKGR